MMKNFKWKSYLVLLILSLSIFLENFGRYLYSVAVIPFVSTSSYEYTLLSGLLFTFFYTSSGLFLVLISESFYSNKNEHTQNTILLTTNHNKDHQHKNKTESSTRFCYTSSFSSSTLKIIFLTIASLIFSIAYGFTAYTSAFYQLVMIRIIMGISQSIITPFSIYLIGTCFQDDEKGFVYSLYQLGNYFAFSSSLSLGTSMYYQYGWKMTYMMSGIWGLFLSCFIPWVYCLLPSSSSSSSSSLTMPLSEDLEQHQQQQQQQGNLFVTIVSPLHDDDYSMKTSTTDVDIVITNTKDNNDATAITTATKSARGFRHSAQYSTVSSTDNIIDININNNKNKNHHNRAIDESKDEFRVEIIDDDDDNSLLSTEGYSRHHDSRYCLLLPQKHDDSSSTGCININNNNNSSCGGNDDNNNNNNNNSSSSNNNSISNINNNHNSMVGTNSSVGLSNDNNNNDDDDDDDDDDIQPLHQTHNHNNSNSNNKTTTHTRHSNHHTRTRRSNHHTHHHDLIHNQLQQQQSQQQALHRIDLHPSPPSHHHHHHHHHPPPPHHHPPPPPHHRFLMLSYDLFHFWMLERPLLLLVSVTGGVRLSAGFILATYLSVFFSELWIRQPMMMNTPLQQQQQAFKRFYDQKQTEYEYNHHHYHYYSYYDQNSSNHHHHHHHMKTNSYSQFDGDDDYSITSGNNDNNNSSSSSSSNTGNSNSNTFRLTDHKHTSTAPTGHTHHDRYTSLPTSHYQSCRYSYNATYSSSSSSSSSSSQYMCGQAYPYCVNYSNHNNDTHADGMMPSYYYCSALNDSPWHGTGMPHTTFAYYIAWVPLIGSALGSVLGALLADHCTAHFGLYMRPFLVSLGNLVALPFIVMALYASSPGCFICLIVSGFWGELYLSQSLTLITTLAVADKNSRSSSSSSSCTGYDDDDYNRKINHHHHQDENGDNNDSRRSSSANSTEPLVAYNNHKHNNNNNTSAVYVNNINDDDDDDDHTSITNTTSITTTTSAKMNHITPFTSAPSSSSSSSSSSSPSDTVIIPSDINSNHNNHNIYSNNSINNNNSYNDNNAIHTNNSNNSNDNNSCHNNNSSHKDLVSCSVALFVMITSSTASIIMLLVPFLHHIFKSILADISLEVTIAAYYDDDDNNDDDTYYNRSSSNNNTMITSESSSSSIVTAAYTHRVATQASHSMTVLPIVTQEAVVLIKGANSLRYSLMVTLILTYGLSVILFYLVYAQLKSIHSSNSRSSINNNSRSNSSNRSSSSSSTIRRSDDDNRNNDDKNNNISMRAVDS